MKTIHDYLNKELSYYFPTWFKDPLSYVITDLYEQIGEDNIAIHHPLPFSSEPTLAVVKGGKYNIQAVTTYGEQESFDAAARKPLDFIKDMAGTENIINMDSVHSVVQRKHIKPLMTERKSLDAIYAETLAQFSSLMKEWDVSMSLNHQFGFACTNVVATCVLGLPALSKAQAHVITHAGSLLRESMPGAEDFNAGKAALKMLNEDMLSEHCDILLAGDKYIHRKADIAPNDTHDTQLAKLQATYGVSNLLVENNLTALIMMAVMQINQSEDLRNKLLAEIDVTKDMSLEALRALPFLDCVYKESLRFCTPTPMIIRETSKPMELTIKNEEGKEQRFRLPSHSLLFAPLRRVHHDKNYWEKPAEFNPDRFKNPAAMAHFIPFSMGKRSCPGEAHFNEIVFKAAIFSCIHYKMQFDKPIEPIPADSLTSRWKQEYYVTNLEANSRKLLTTLFAI